MNVMTKARTLLAATALFAAIAAPSANANYLVYDPGGGQDNVQAAMTSLGFSYDVRNAGNPVTAGDLSSHQALIVGWSVGGNYSGLTPSIIGAGITGNRIITGHDADYHTAVGNAAAATLMSRYVQFAGASAGNPGLVAFPNDYNTPFSYLPSTWLTSVGMTGETITAITGDGMASGLYAGLTLAQLSNWGNSYHSVFSAYDSTVFQVFETGIGPTGSRTAPVTLGFTVTPISIPVPATAALMLASLALFGFRSARRK